MRDLRTITVLMLLALAGTADAEPSYVTIPGQGWHLLVDVPPLTSSESKSNGERFSYTGADTKSGLTFSVHTEVMPLGGNLDCRRIIWKMSAENPYIVQDAVEMFETGNLAGLTYRSEGEYQGRPFTTVNAHGYFIVDGKCVDLHVSQIPFTAAGKETVERIVRTARIVRQAPRAR